MPYLFLDCEMGGLEKEKYSLLTAYLLFVDDDLNPIDDLYLRVKPDDGIYHVCGEAMNVNKIDLREHDKTAVTYKVAGGLLYNWLKGVSNGGQVKLTPVGHGVYYDVDWILYFILNKKTWDNFVSYRKIDTQAIAQFMRACGLFPDDAGTSLGALGSYFGIPVKEDELHDAKTDTHLTLGVFKGFRSEVMGEPWPEADFQNDV